MRQRLDPKLSILPPAQREIWSRLALSVRLGFVLYGGTAIALHLGLAKMPGGGTVKVSFFGGISFGRVHDPLETIDGILLVASLDDLMATKLKALLDRAEVKDYRDIAMMISMGVSLPAGLSAFREMFKGEPAQVLRAIGYFEHGDVTTLGASDRKILCDARDRVGPLPDVHLKSGSLAGD